MRAVVVGAVESTRVAIQALIDADAALAAVLTLSPALAARHSDYVDLAPVAEQARIPVVDAPKINAPEIIERLRELAPDYLFVIGWSQICNQEVLSLPRDGVIGYHPSRLPENRGRAVIPWTILQGRTETGSTLFWMDEGTDTGDLLAQETFPVAADETAATLYAKHLEALRRMLAGVVPLLRERTAPRIPQDHSRASWCARRTAEDGLVDWNAPAHTVWTLIRATGEPYPGAFTSRQGRRLVLREAEYVGRAPYWGLPGQVQALLPDGALVQCGDGEHLLLRRVQTEGGEPEAAQAALKMHERLGFDWGVLYSQVQGGR